MANPRKFSEKIALHNQKQAEETAAFEAIMRDVAGATRQPGMHKVYPNNTLQLQNLGAYRGGSLPNVNQMANNSIDLRSALHNLEDMKQGRPHPAERFSRDRARQMPGNRRPFPNRGDYSPYGSAYLLPPPDTSWRRVASDSDIPNSAMGHHKHHLQGGATPPTHRRMNEMHGALGNDERLWDPKKQQLIQQSSSRPKSCEVPGINIYPTTEQDNGTHIPISNNTGSLPDLTNLHFPPPLTTPLDAEDQQYAPVGSPQNLSPTAAHHISLAQRQHQQQQQQQSPGTRRRQTSTGPSSPLVIDLSQQSMASPPGQPMNSPTQIGQPMNSPTQIGRPMQAPDNGQLTPKVIMYQMLQQKYLLQQKQQQLLEQQQKQQQQQRQQQQQQNGLSNIIESNVNNQKQPSMTHYRNTGTPDSQQQCQSPTSPGPLSPGHYSPAQSPGTSAPQSNGGDPANFQNTLDNYYLDQQQQQQQTDALQTDALQHQFQQNFVLQDNVITSISNMNYNNSQMSFTQSQLQGSVPGGGGQVQGTVSGGGVGQPLDQEQYHQHQQFFPPSHPSPQSPHPNMNSPMTPQGMESPKNNTIPDIILTGADETLISNMRQDFAKDLGNAMISVDSFDTDNFFPSDEALKVGLDPLDLDGLQMLTDPSLVADPATEDSFRLDRL